MKLITENILEGVESFKIIFGKIVLVVQSSIFLMDSSNIAEIAAVECRGC